MSIDSTFSFSCLANDDFPRDSFSQFFFFYLAGYHLRSEGSIWDFSFLCSRSREIVSFKIHGLLPSFLFISQDGFAQNFDLRFRLLFPPFFFFLFKILLSFLLFSIDSFTFLSLLFIERLNARVTDCYFVFTKYTIAMCLIQFERCVWYNSKLTRS